jgi:hypothetical protein
MKAAMLTKAHHPMAAAMATSMKVLCPMRAPMLMQAPVTLMPTQTLDPSILTWTAVVQTLTSMRARHPMMEVRSTLTEAHHPMRGHQT